MTDTGRLGTALADRYQLVRHLGQGGMATVYLARDVKHNRQVALKVLRPELAAVIGAERFLKEIEVTANLQHPNILALYDSGHADTFLYYVMPFVEGESLRAKLSREKQLGVDETITISKAVAAALDYAHRHGVIHRDIKPENILLHDGQAMVADFGIALAVSQAGGTRMTETGLSLGTPHYMSPEQATGDRTLDARSDVYSLGAVTYEMLTGDPPHTGNTMQAIVAKVLSATPAPITQIRSLVPPNVDAAVQRALAKTPADRFATAAEFGAALTNPGFTLPTQSVAAIKGTHALSSRALVVALAALVLVTAALGWSLFGRKTPAQRTLRLGIALPDDKPMAFNSYGTIAMSPDATTIVYAGVAAGKPMLIARRLDQLNAEAIAGTEGGSQPFFSPDSKWIGFFAGGSLKKVALSGSPPVVLTRAANPRGGAWLDDGHIVYTPSSTGGLYRVPEDGGGTPQEVTVIDSAARIAGVTGHRWAAPLPGGRGVLFASFQGSISQARVCVAPTTGPARCILSGVSPRYLPAGYLVYVAADGALTVVPFDLSRLDTAGPPRTISSGIAVDAAAAFANYSVADDGTLAYLGGSLMRALVRVARDGAERVMVGSIGAPNAPRFSHDGTRIAMEAQAGTDLRVWLYDVERSVNTPLTFSGQGRYPSWNANSTRLLFSQITNTNTARDIYDVSANGSGAPQLVYSGPGDQFESALLPDGRHLVVRTSATPSGNRDISIVPVAGVANDSMRPIAATPADERAIALSPDGKWLAYTSDESQQTEVYVRPIGGDGGKVQVSRNGGYEPVWSRDGHELFYRDLQNLIAVKVQLSPTFSVLGSTPLFRDGVYARNPDRANYDVHPSGQWFVMSRNVATRADLVVAFNWLHELNVAR